MDYKNMAKMKPQEKKRKIFAKMFGGLKKVVFLQPQTKGH